MANGVAPYTFDETLALNVDGFNSLNPLNYSLWYGVLYDLGVSLFSWESMFIPEFDRGKIERYIFEHSNFALIRLKKRIGDVVVYSEDYYIFKVTVINRDSRQRPIRVRIIPEHGVGDYELEYDLDEFVYYNQDTLTIPSVVANKYAEMLSKLDALYEQNCEKMGLPLMGVATKQVKNQLLEMFKRAKRFALFMMVNPDNAFKNDVERMVFNPKVDFILDKVSGERDKIMKEYLQEMGVNPLDGFHNTSQYVNTAAVNESSLISRYFASGLNRTRVRFVREVNEKFGIGLSFHTSTSKDLDWIEEREEQRKKNEMMKEGEEEVVEPEVHAFED